MVVLYSVFFLRAHLEKYKLAVLLGSCRCVSHHARRKISSVRGLWRVVGISGDMLRNENLRKISPTQGVGEGGIEEEAHVKQMRHKN